MVNKDYKHGLFNFYCWFDDLTLYNMLLWSIGSRISSPHPLVFLNECPTSYHGLRGKNTVTLIWSKSIIKVWAILWAKEFLNETDSLWSNRRDKFFKFKICRTIGKETLKEKERNFLITTLWNKSFFCNLKISLLIILYSFIIYIFSKENKFQWIK